MNKALSAALALAGLVALAPFAQAKLPAPSPEAKAKADETKAKTAWSDKVAAYKLCLVQDKVAADYFKHKGAGKKASMPTPPCADPGPYVAQVAEVGVADSKPVPEAGSKQPPPQKK
ncbi:hypothetical protein [Pseudoduganella sp. RAF53_2]|uniref:hypothetical protein n=1 Tax=unclassified Pseudoduganella TaxID=2637179 RepID=UPI003F9AC09F